jgi:ubiquinone/menaquinone biosynthesis C-methylase UbiE
VSLAPLVYNWTIESPLKKVKQKIARLVSRYELFPVLDVCCGTGQQVRYVHLLGQPAFGLDLDIQMLSYAQKKQGEVAWICADAVHLPFPADSFGGVILSYALHEKSEDVRRRMMDEVRRTLSANGMVIFLDFENPWNRRARLGAAVTWLIERNAGGEHFANGRRFLSAGGLRSFIRENGLSEIKSYDLELSCSRITAARFL